MEKYVITISRRFASNGHAIAARAGQLLGIPVYDRSEVEARVSSLEGALTEARESAADENTADPARGTDAGRGRWMGLFHREGREEAEDPARTEFDRQCEVIRSLAEEGSCIIIGRCADEIFLDDPSALHVFIFASDEVRLKNGMELLHTGQEETKALIQNEDRAREEYRRRFARHADDELAIRHLLINSGRLGVEESAALIAHAAEHLFQEP